MIVLETDRLVLRRLCVEDAEFILGLLNEPSWLEFIGDKGVRTLEDARDYLLKGPIDMYNRLGFGLYLVELKSDGIPIGICGLIKRDALKDVDIGFAFIPKFWGKGYAYEAASAVLAYGKSALGLNRIVAITSPNNHSSIKLLEKLGLSFEGMIRLSANAPEVKLFAKPFTDSVVEEGDEGRGHCGMKNEENLRIPENRELTAEEISLLRWLLENGLPETRNLLPQLKDVRVVSRCGCGCPTIDLQVLGTKPRASAIAQIVADFIGKTPEGMEVGVILRSQEGNLVELEVYCFGENEGRFNLPLIESLQDFPKSKPH